MAMTDTATTLTAPDPQRFGSVLASAERLSVAALADDTDRDLVALLAAAEWAMLAEDPSVTQPEACDAPADQAAVSAPWRGEPSTW